MIQFLASTYNGEAFPFNLFELRRVDVETGDDMLVCIDALRRAKTDLYKLAPNGEKRVLAARRGACDGRKMLNVGLADSGS